MNIRITGSGRRHRIGVLHIVTAMLNAGEPMVVGDSYWYRGRDDRGVELEIIAVPDNRGRTGLAVIHAMPAAYRESP
jgi:hypothetical protein